MAIRRRRSMRRRGKRGLSGLGLLTHEHVSEADFYMKTVERDVRALTSTLRCPSAAEMWDAGTNIGKAAANLKYADGSRDLTASDKARVGSLLDRYDKSVRALSRHLHQRCSLKGKV